MVIAEPPVAPAVNATDRLPFPGVMLVMVGALGVVLGVAAVIVDTVPSPATLTARICTLYEVPLLNPVMAIGLVVTPAAVQVDPSVVYL